MKPRYPLFLSLSLAYLQNRKRQTMVSVLGVMLGVGFFIGIYAMMQGMQSYFIKKIIDVSPHVIMKDEHRAPPIQPLQRLFQHSVIGLSGLKPKEELRGIRSAERIMNTLQKKEGVNVAPVLEGQAFIRYGGKDVGTNIIGIEPELEKKVSHLENDLIEGSMKALLTHSDGIILGEALANKLGARIRSKVSVISPAGLVLTMKVVGIFSTGITQLDTFNSYALLKKVQVLQDRENVINQLRIRLENIERANSLARQWESIYGYRTEGWEEMNQNVFTIFVIQNGIMYATVLAILIVAGFGIFNIISTIVNEKREDIAILKAIGFSEIDIQRIFLCQGLIVGIIGTLLGWVLGATLIEFLGTIRFRLEGEAFMRLDGFILYRSVWQYAISGVLAVAASSFSAYFPARRAARVNPVDIIRGSV